MNAEQLFEKIAEVRPEVHAFFAATQQEVQESPFRDEIVARLSYITKTAGQLANLGMGVGASIATGVAYNLAGDLYDSLRRGLTKSRNYRNMLAANPELKKEDGQKVRRAFEVLHQYNPDFAGNPVVAGSFVRDQAQLNELGNIQMLGNLVSARKNLSDIRKLPTPGNLPMWDKEGPEDKEYKKLQIKKLEGELSTQHEFMQAELQKLKHEADPKMFELRMKQLEMGTGPLAQQKAQKEVDILGQNFDLNKGKLDPLTGEGAWRDLQMTEKRRTMPSEFEALRAQSLGERRLTRMSRMFHNDPDYIPGDTTRTGMTRKSKAHHDKNP